MIEKLLKSNKIAIFGWPATGKSTLARFISDKLNIKVYSLDIIRWNYSENGIKDSVKFMEEYANILKEDKWIIEGNALDWIEPRLEQADILIFFDSTVDECIRNYKNREKRVQFGIEERLSFDKTKTTNDVIEWINNRYKKKIENLRPILNEFKYKIIIINNYNELDNIIKEILITLLEQ